MPIGERAGAMRRVGRGVRLHLDPTDEARARARVDLAWRARQHRVSSTQKYACAFRSPTDHRWFQTPFEPSHARFNTRPFQSRFRVLSDRKDFRTDGARMAHDSCTPYITTRAPAARSPHRRALCRASPRLRASGTRSGLITPRAMASRVSSLATARVSAKPRVSSRPRVTSTICRARSGPRDDDVAPSRSPACAVRRRRAGRHAPPRRARTRLRGRADEGVRDEQDKYAFRAERLGAGGGSTDNPHTRRVVAPTPPTSPRST